VTPVIFLYMEQLRGTVVGLARRIRRVPQLPAAASEAPAE
jgi:hypothetical protein